MLLSCWIIPKEFHNSLNPPSSPLNLRGEWRKGKIQRRKAPTQKPEEPQFDVAYKNVSSETI